MVQIGAALSGFALYALFVWLPIWRMAHADSADGLFRYFVVVMMLLFGVFMVSGGRKAFSVTRFVPAFGSGCLASYGFAGGNMLVLAAGVMLGGLFYLMFGE